MSIPFPPIEEFREWLRSLPDGQTFDSSEEGGWNCRCPVALFLRSKGEGDIRVGRFLAWREGHRDETSIPKPYHAMIAAADGLRLFTAKVYRDFLETYHG
jgi:hypothetical protein